MSSSMSKNQNDIRTKAYVLRRTNYGEADRILNLITPEGKISAMARGVRKEKSRLSGGIEMFSLIDINIHNGRGELGVVTSSKMLKYYNNIVTDLARMELAALILKKVSLFSENSGGKDYFRIVDQTLAMINVGVLLELVEAWFWLNLVKANGEQVNMYRDADGDKLSEDETYSWSAHEEVLMKNPRGEIGADEIKIIRLMLSADLSVVTRVKDVNDKIKPILMVARALGKV